MKYEYQTIFDKILSDININRNVNTNSKDLTENQLSTNKLRYLLLLSLTSYNYKETNLEGNIIN